IVQGDRRGARTDGGGYARLRLRRPPDLAPLLPDPRSRRIGWIDGHGAGAAGLRVRQSRIEGGLPGKGLGFRLPIAYCQLRFAILFLLDAADSTEESCFATPIVPD